jgi:hypothetical protein
MSDMFLISNVLKQGDAISPLLFKFALEYAYRSVQVDQDGLKLDGTHNIYDIYFILGGSDHFLCIWA